jgi:hypothetical protein
MSVKWSGGSGGGGSSGATADELARLDQVDDNILVNFHIDAVSDDNALQEIIQGFSDAFNDTAGLDLVTSTGETHTDSGAGNDSYFAGSAMVLVNNSRTASAAPDTVRAVLLYDPQVAATLNTDCTFEVSRDNGTTWETATLTKSGDLTASIEILTTGDIDVSAQPSGTTMLYRYSNLNAKDQRLHGAGMIWR